MVRGYRKATDTCDRGDSRSAMIRRPMLTPAYDISPPLSTSYMLLKEITLKETTHGDKVIISSR